jgi:hypothetical protein
VSPFAAVVVDPPPEGEGDDVEEDAEEEVEHG